VKKSENFDFFIDKSQNGLLIWQNNPHERR